MARAVVVLAEGFEEMEAVIVIDVLRRAGVEVTTVGVGGRQVEGAHALTLVADALVEEAPREVDAVVLPGGMPGAEHLAASGAVTALLRAVHDGGGIVAAICAAPAVALAPTGLLAGRRATCYPGFEARFPGDVTAIDAPVVVDGPFVTSRGPGTAFAFALALVERLVSPEGAADLGRRMLVDAG